MGFLVGWYVVDVFDFFGSADALGDDPGDGCFERAFVDVIDDGLWSFDDVAQCFTDDSH